MTQEPSPKGANGGRDSRTGRFLPGNRGGPGNPHARRVAKLRSTLLRAVSADDVRGIVQGLVNSAKAGNVPAAKMRTPSHAPVSVTRSCACHSAAGSWSAGLTIIRAALLCTTSMRPCRSATCAASSVHSSAAATSSRCAVACPPAASISLATALARSPMPSSDDYQAEATFRHKICKYY